MKAGWFWPMPGKHCDFVFKSAASRGRRVVEQLLMGFSGTLQTDGYEVYARHRTDHENINHALCWSYTRRFFPGWLRIPMIWKDHCGLFLRDELALLFERGRAEHAAIIQTLLATCRAHDVHPYHYLVTYWRVANEPGALATLRFRIGELPVTYKIR